MRNLIITVILAILCIFFSSDHYESKNINFNDEITLTSEYTTLSNNEIYKDISLYLLYPKIQEEVNKYYLRYLTDSPIVYLYPPYGNIINVEKTFGGEIIIKLRITPVYGPHIRVGMDDITLKIGIGKATVISFNHIKSFELPQRYVQFIRKGYNNPIP